MNLVLSLACDDARVRPDGKLDLSGIFNELSAPGFPAAHEKMTVVFVMEWPHDASGTIQLRADLVDDDDQKVLTIQGHTEVQPRPAGHAPAQTRLIMPIDKVVFPHAGRYTFQLRAGDHTVRAFSLFVGERKNPQDDRG